MKKVLFFVAALAMALTISCTKEQAVQTAQEGEVTLVSFAVSVPEGIATRALTGTTFDRGNGASAMQLHYTVKEEISSAIVYDDVVTNAFASGLTTQLQLKLNVGTTYNIVMWADAQDSPYTYDKGAVSISTKNKVNGVDEFATPNDEAYDAFFYSSIDEDFECITITSSTFQKNITLKRPFAQINVAASEEDFMAATQLLQAEDNTRMIAESGMSVNIGGVTTPNSQTFNLFDKTLENSTCEFIFRRNYIPGYDSVNGTFTPEVLTTNGQDYVLLSTVYVFAPASSSKTADIVFSWWPNKNPASSSSTFTSVPIRRNWRTNIVGNVLTSTSTFNITIEPNFKDANLVTKAVDPDNQPEDVLDFSEVVNGYGKIYSMGGGNHLIQDKVVKFSTKPYGGLNQADTIKFKNCYIDGCMFGYTALEFEDCTFRGNRQIEPLNTIYPIWTYGSQYVSFKNCLFNNRYTKAILVYNEGGVTNINVKVDNCTFQSNVPDLFSNRRAAVEIHTEYGIKGTIQFDNCTLNNYYSHLYQEYNNNTDTTTTDFRIIVNGNVVQQGTLSNND